MQSVLSVLLPACLMLLSFFTLLASRAKTACSLVGRLWWEQEQQQDEVKGAPQSTPTGAVKVPSNYDGDSDSSFSARVRRTLRQNGDSQK